MPAARLWYWPIVQKRISYVPVRVDMVQIERYHDPALAPNDRPVRMTIFPSHGRQPTGERIIGLKVAAWNVNQFAHRYGQGPSSSQS